MRYRLPAEVAWVEGAEAAPDGPDIYLMVVPDGSPVVLKGVAGLVWRVAASGDDVVPSVAQLAGQQQEEIRDDVLGFLDDLVEHGLLEREPAADRREGVGP